MWFKHWLEYTVRSFWTLLLNIFGINKSTQLKQWLFSIHFASGFLQFWLPWLLSYRMTVKTVMILFFLECYASFHLEEEMPWSKQHLQHNFLHFEVVNHYSSNLHGLGSCGVVHIDSDTNLVWSDSDTNLVWSRFLWSNAHELRYCSSKFCGLGSRGVTPVDSSLETVSESPREKPTPHTQRQRTDASR